MLKLIQDERAILDHGYILRVIGKKMLKKDIPTVSLLRLTHPMVVTL